MGNDSLTPNPLPGGEGSEAVRPFSRFQHISSLSLFRERAGVRVKAQAPLNSREGTDMIRFKEVLQNGKRFWTNAL